MPTRDAPLKRLNYGGERERGGGDQGNRCSFLELSDPGIGNFAADAADYRYSGFHSTAAVCRFLVVQV